jgi:hypothetical protein
METTDMSPRRSAKVVALCGTVVLAAAFVVRLGDLGPAVLETTASLPVAPERAALLTADVKLTEASQATAIENAAVDASVAIADVPTSAELETPTLAITAAVADESKAAVVSDEPVMVLAALHDPSQAPESESPPLQVASVTPSDRAPEQVRGAVKAIEILDECLVADVCIDRYLWALYQRTPKQDSIKVHERRKVTVKRKGKMVTVTRSFTRRVDEDFTWKDPTAAERAGMSMMDYVIGGMDRSFKTKLFHALRAAEQAGMSPGITSAFRDDYRQAIASGMKAATGRSFHGGSSRGGYGHGLAADVVSVDGATRAQRWVSTENFWKWIDAHGKEFGIGRPYLGRDPPHVGPIDGQEYASRRGAKVQQAALDSKKRSRVAMRDDHGAAKPSKKRKVTEAASPVHRPKHEATSARRKIAMAEPGRG